MHDSQLAEQLLAAARKSGDRQHEASALIDLGMTYRAGGNAPRARALFEEALAMARASQDAARAGDALGSLGLLALDAGQARTALELLKQELESARSAGDRCAEALALGHLAFCHASLGDTAAALSSCEQALTIAREVGDRQQEANLLWFLATQHGASGQRESAIRRAQAAVNLLDELQLPYRDLYAEYLERYRQDEGGGPSLARYPSATIVSGWETGSQAASTPRANWLQMAFSAARSMATFLASGMQRVTPEAHQKRLQICAGCERYTGLRCRVCGCFINPKAWLLHERCPIGKWDSGA
jgi:tetratricopeptide (TPR) repeat protein